MEAKKHLLKRIGGTDYEYDYEKDIITASDRIQRGDTFSRTVHGLPVDLCIELTTECNFQCKNCFSKSIPGLTTDRMLASDLLSFLVNTHSQFIRLCVTGGEPLMHPEIESILSLPRQFSSLGYVLSTNGTVRGELDSAIVDNRWLVAVSLHGGEETHNSYTNSRSWKRVVKRIASLAQSTNVHIYSVVHERMNISDVDWLLRFQAENGVKFLRFIAPRNFGRYENSCNTDLYEYVNSLEGASIGFKTSSSNTRFLPVSGVPRMSN